MKKSLFMLVSVFALVLQGASGIAMRLLGLDSFERGDRTWITFSDSPF